MHEKQSNSPNLVRRVAPAAAIGVAAVSLFSSGVMHSKQSHHHITTRPEVVKAHPNHEAIMTSEQSTTLSFFFRQFIAQHEMRHNPIHIDKDVPTGIQGELIDMSSKPPEKLPAVTETTTTTTAVPARTETVPAPISHSQGRGSHFTRANVINIQPTVGNYWFGSPAIYHKFVGTPAENANVALTYEIASQQGLNNHEIACLDNTWGRESGFDNTATNPSGAGGIAQLDPDTSYINLPPAQQITVGLSYIEGRYGSPCVAEQHWNKAAAADNGKGWY
jgi:hypothetical protein